MEVALVVAGIVALFLFTQRWFWLLVFGLSALASFFSMIASVIHFQILAAVGFFILTTLLAGIIRIIGDGY